MSIAIGRTASFGANQSTAPALCHGPPWLATLRACWKPAECKGARPRTIKPLHNGMSAPVRSAQL